MTEFYVYSYYGNENSVNRNRDSEHCGMCFPIAVMGERCAIIMEEISGYIYTEIRNLNALFINKCGF